jgi:uncharacterized membrane protein
MKMQINKIIWWNLGLIVSIAVYGIITDEPYWKANGHDQTCMITFSGSPPP